jgi:hypothetical protein
VGYEIHELEPSPEEIQIPEVVITNELIANTIDNFGKLLEQYEPTSTGLMG